MEDKVRAHAIISGRVQGVFYRMETKSAAERLGVNGWVRNKPNGTVEAMVEGEKKAVEALIAWCKENMASYKYPRIIEIRDALPMTATGKILKRELRD